MRRAAALLLIVVLGACVPPKGKKTAAKAAPGRAPASASNNVAQKRAYDLGVTHFGEERYAEAKKAWQEAVKLGPSTPLGLKSKENLKKVDAILASLSELEKQ